MNQPTKNPPAQAPSQAEKLLALSHFIFAPLSDFAPLTDTAIEASTEALCVAVEFAGQPYAINLRRYDAMHASLKASLTAVAQDLAGYPSAPDLYSLQAAFAQHQEAYQQDLHALHQANGWLQTKLEESQAQLEAKINALACDDQPNSALASQLQALQQTVADHYADLDEKIRIARQIEEHSTLEVYARLTNLAQLGVENQARISALEAHLAKP